MEVKYTKLNTDAKLVAHSVKSDLTPALGRSQQPDVNLHTNTWQPV